MDRGKQLTASKFWLCVSVRKQASRFQCADAVPGTLKLFQLGAGPRLKLFSRYRRPFPTRAAFYGAKETRLRRQACQTLVLMWNTRGLMRCGGPKADLAAENGGSVATF
jgi:hypothetical protein